MAAAGLDWFVITDRDSIYYFTAAENYIERIYNRPTVLIVPREGECSVLAPFGDCPMIGVMSWIRQVVPYKDGDAVTWDKALLEILSASRGPIGIETNYDSMVVRALAEGRGRETLVDASALIEDMRLIKDAEEIRLARQSGQVADAMMQACRDALREGVPEYEVSLAAIAAGTRAAAGFLSDKGPGRLRSPMIHGIQVMKSGATTVLGHCRPTVHCVEAGEPVAVCLCGMVDFGNMKLAMDRPFLVGRMTSQQEEICRTAYESQIKGIEAVRPGATAQDIHHAAIEVLLSKGYNVSSRTGRGLGHSYFEKPQLVNGDTTILRPGMILAIDGNIKVPGFGVQYGDSVLVTEDGYEMLTDFMSDPLIA
jgi:Xaa-Pro aminopeptidase